MRSIYCLRPTLVVGLTLGLALAAQPARAGVLDGVLPLVDADTAQALQAAEPFLDPASGPAQPLPAQPHAALSDAIEALSAELGFLQQADLAVAAAGLSDERAGRLALVVQDLLACHLVTTAHMAQLTGERIRTAMRYGPAAAGLNAADFADIRTCAEALWRSANELMVALDGDDGSGPLPLASSAAASDLELWPVIAFDQDGSNDVRVHDFALIVDEGGDDIYVNNAGSNMIDVNLGPEGSAARLKGPAVGCQQAVTGLSNGDCVPSAALLIDRSGNDLYGVKQSPDVDAVCTREDVIRRMVIGGVGFSGVGMLLDRAGDDTYDGKQVTLGAGHVFGVGVLHDFDGNDGYSLVRNGGGFGLVGGLGILRDHAGSDVREFHIPAPLDPKAPNQTPGAGGVIDDEDVCDNQPRLDWGAANIASVGVLVDDAGRDRYRGGFTAGFLQPPEATEFGPAGSLGFGISGGVGLLLDRAGRDSYQVRGDANTPAPGSTERRDHVTLLPDGGEVTGSGVFVDE